MPTKAKRIRKLRFRKGTGLETVVALTANAGAIVSVVGTLGALLSFTLPGLFAAFLTLAGGFFGWLMLHCLAEHLRLQKKIAGLRFEGKITGPTSEEVWTCSECEMVLHSESWCDGCGAEIEKG